MEGMQPGSQAVVGRELIVKADEVDQVGTAIQSPSNQLPLSALDRRDDTASTTGRTTQTKATRPVLRREGSAPPPPSQPPPPAPPLEQTPDTPTDSLSLPQLKQLVSQFPKVEPRAYAFQYADAQSFTEEIDEWFQYSEQDGAMILSAKDTFEQKWRSFSEAHKGLAEEENSWTSVSDAVRKTIMLSVLSSLDHCDRPTRIESLEVIFYILGGAWTATAGLERHGEPAEVPTGGQNGNQTSSTQIEWMHKGAALLVDCSGLQILQDCAKRAFGEDDERYSRLMTFSAHQLTRL
jgi:N1221-like protein